MGGLLTVTASRTGGGFTVLGLRDSIFFTRFLASSTAKALPWEETWPRYLVLQIQQ